MPHPLHALFAFGVNRYFRFMAVKHTRFKKGAMTKKLLCKKHYGLQSVFGWEGDRHAPIAFADGCYLLRDRGNVLVHFGFTEKDITGKIDWHNREGFLPCLVSRFAAGTLEVTLESFADKLTLQGRDFVAAYSRMTLCNRGQDAVAMRDVSKYLIPLTDVPRSVEAGETVTADFAIFADRFGGTYPFPPADTLRTAGDWQSHYVHMKAYWTQRLSEIAQPTLPDKELVNAYKAGYIYTMIVKDGDRLHVGENGYDNVFDHDTLGITAALLTMGDFRHFREYAAHILDHVLYPDARWKYSWPFALYLQKTGDRAYVQEKFSEIAENTHTIEGDRGEYGIMKPTNAIDSLGHWTVDNWSALTGLSAYKYICDELRKTEEAAWASAQYDSLLKACNAQLEGLMREQGIDYIPISMTRPNEKGQRRDPRDANALSMFLFGRWAWDGYLLGAPQYGVMLDKIDSTYEYVGRMRRTVSDSPYNFGGYPHGWYCSAYNAGYGSAALRGEKYRSAGIEAYRFMIEHAMSGPFSWWEAVGYPAETSVWNRPHAACGGGACPHIWGQSTASKTLLDALIAEKTDGTLILFRGIPEAWYGETVAVDNYPVQGGRVCVRMENGKKITLSGAVGERRVELNLPAGVRSVQIPQDAVEWEISL